MINNDPALTDGTATFEKSPTDQCFNAELNLPLWGANKIGKIHWLLQRK